MLRFEKEIAMIELTPDQHQALATSGGAPARARDPVTNDEYVLLRAEVYDRIKLLVVDDQNWTPGAYTAAMEAFARDGWDDPRMDVYNALEPRKDP
jgi:hypothetical protein